MTLQEFIEIVGGDDEAYAAQVDLLINGESVDDVSFGIIPSTGRMIINLEHYE